jgi:Rad51
MWKEKRSDPVLMSLYTTQSIQLSFEISSALEKFNEHRNTLKMTTGSADLDSLVDGIQEGIFYLFYGNNHAILDAMVYRFLINCVLPIKQKHGFESMGVCFNNTDYYYHHDAAKKSSVLSPEKIGVAAKCAGIDPKIVFKNLYIHPAYNEQHQLLVAEQVADLITSNKDIKLLVVNRITKFFKESKNKMEIANILKQVIGIISKACAKNKVALVCTGDSNTTARGIIPRPIGGIYLKHAANVIVHIREYSKTSAIPSFKATLIKHQYTKTPKSAILYIRKTGGMVLLD